MVSGQNMKKIRNNQTATYCLYFIGFMDLCVVSMGLSLTTRKARELGATPSVAGLIASIYGGIQLFSSPLIGKFSDLSGRKKVLVIALVCTGVAYFMVGLSNSLIILALSRVPVGIFKQTQGLCKVSLADITPTLDRPKVFGYYNSIASTGFVIGPLIGGHIGMTEHGFFKVMALQAVGFISMAAFGWFFLDIPNSSTSKREGIPLEKNSDNEDEEDSHTSKGEETKATHHKDNGTANSQALGHCSSMFKTFLIRVGNFFSIASLDSIVDLLLLRFVMGFAMILFRSNFTTMLEYRYHTSPRTSGYILSFKGIISGISGIVVGYIVVFYKHKDAKALLHCSILITIALFGITYSPDLWVLVVFLAPLSFTTAVSRVCLNNLTLQRCNPEERGVILGVGNSMLSFARMLSPLLAGIALEFSMYGPGLVSVAIASIGISIAAFVIN